MLQKTLAVLPFVNRSSDPENEYFSDGITEEIINALSKLDALKVISRTSSFYFKGKNIPLRDIAKQLNAQTVLEGSVRVAHGQVRVAAQLIQAEEDVHIWSDTWDRKLENIFEVQDEISLLIADKLREHFGHFEIAEHLADKPTDSLDAYQLLLKARYHMNRWNPEDVQKAITLYEQVVQLDPNHADGYVGLADGHSFLGTTGFADGAISWGKAIEFTHKALALDAKNAGAHYLLANIAFFVECDFGAALKHALKTVSLKANYPKGQQFLSLLYTLRGDKVLAKKHLDLALALDPLNQETLFYKGFYLYRQEEFEKAEVLFKDLLLENPKNIPAFTLLAYAFLMQKKHKEALQLFEALPQDVVIPDEKLGVSCLAHILGGAQEKANEGLEALENQAQQATAFQAHSYLFLVYAQLHRFDDAFALLESALAKHSSIFLISYSDPLTGFLSREERYSKFHKKIYPPVLGNLEAPEKKQALLDETTAAAFTEKLLAFVAQETPFLNPELSLRALAERIEVHPNQLSWLLNTQLQKNFNEFINHYRVAHFKALATDPANGHISLLGLAFESGFNSKTVFNTFFKKATGMTPSAFVKSLK